jgi:ectoine hydroxylase-related dioxygenase (phytanoyl-CoA dioxygenase family)
MPVAPGVAHEEQRSLEDMGFAVLRGCLDQHTIADMQEVLDRLTHPGSLAPGETFYDNRDEVRGAGDGSQLTAFGDHQLRLSNLQRRHEVFHQLIDHPRVLPLLHQYMREPRLAGDWHIRTECGPRSSWWHRGTGIDGWRVHPHDQRRRLSKQLNVAWLLDDQASGEGCLLVWPRSHLRDFHGSTLNQLSHDFPGLALEGSIEVEGKAGDAVIFVSVDSTSFLRSVSMAFLPHATCRFWAVLIVAAPISNAD